MTKVRLISINRGFGGDEAIYEALDDARTSFRVAVNWALLRPFLTVVFRGTEEVARFEDKRYVQPPEALTRLGYEVMGTVDFAAMVNAVEE